MKDVRKPAIYASYPSGFVSKYYCWFEDCGYPELDILENEKNGEWYIIQMLNSPVIPSLTRWQVVLGPMRNVEKSFSFCHKYINELDITKKAFWAREEAKTRAVYEEADRSERRAHDFANAMTKVVMRDEDLKNRIAKNGAKELDIRVLAMNTPVHEVVKPAFRGERVDVPNSSEPPVESVHARVPAKVHG